MPVKDRPAWDKGPWHESENPTRVVRGATWRAGVWVAAVVAFFMLLGGALWVAGVFTSGVKGTGDVVKQNNGATNRINTQAYFQDLYGDINAYTTQLATAGAQMTAHPGDDFYETNYVGLYNTCVSAVNSYNAASGKTLFKDWKAADLPQTIASADACPQTPFPTASK